MINGNVPESSLMVKVNKMINIWDVAKLAGVSKSTVSRVISDHGSVKPETREKVLAAMKELNYFPSYFAQGIRTGKTKTVAFIIPDTNNIFYNSVLAGAEAVLMANGYMVLSCHTNRNEEREYRYLEDLIKRKVDGIIFSTYNTSEEGLKGLKKLSQEIPIVFLDTIFTDQDEVSYVITEGKVAMEKAVAHLWERKCRRIAYIRPPEIEVMSHRYSGYLSGLQQCGLESGEDLVYKSTSADRGLSHFQLGNHAARYFIEQGLEPDGIIAPTDMLAVGAMNYYMQQGYKVPEEIKIIGYDGLELSKMVYPALTTIAQPVDRIGREAAQIILEKINRGCQFNKKIIFEPELMIRQST